MAEQDQNRSEAATAYRLEQARRKGMVAKSQELGMFASFATCAAYLWIDGGRLARHVAATSAHALAGIGDVARSPAAMSAWFAAVLLDLMHLLAPVTLLTMATAILPAVVQTRFLFAPGALRFELSRLNPVQGFQRLFSWQTLLETGRTLVKAAVYGTIMAACIAPVVVSSSHTPTTPHRLAGLLQGASLALMGKLLIAAAVFAAIDLVVVRRLFAGKMRMSRHEIRQEHKQRDGDPRIKSQRRKIRRELFQQARGLRRVREADVLITNPTHYAVGLKYLPARMAAPMVIAKGTGDFAQRLRKVAFVYGIPVVESPAMARRIFRETRVDQEIPADVYRDAAAIYLRLRARTQRAAA
ncbi:EscU/YscU/HrcU family type III secretion system export apparatus switch protein [Burkholderia plantarii]|uniref:EscU/YscU/HrcU family type III secretion system export apparatus switch protein n=1 Tax=Burkholderia plantarii TaxID=41899 RepID=UPI0009F3A701|nr:EscU/YscU/HrcU family type III secretion system export apparatus switch protein [Burkholderia plantarii]